MTTTSTLLILVFVWDCHAFTLQQPRQQQDPQKSLQVNCFLEKGMQPIFIKPTQLFGSYFDEEPEDNREFARIRRGRKSRTMENNEPDDVVLDDLEDAVDDYYNSYENNSDNDEDNQGLIANPLLDNIDPEGSVERVGEMFTDRQFWIDIGLLLLFLNFLDNLRDPSIFDAIDLANM